MMKAETNKTGYTCKTAHKKKIHTLHSGPQTEIVPSIWKDMCKLWKDEPLQSGVQKFQKQCGS